MLPFQVLDRHIQIHKPHILEASAGTGKTFAIENITIRLLIEANENYPQALSIEEILIITFTRAAAKELKTRIHQNIQRTLSLLKESLINPCTDLYSDYLMAIIQRGKYEINLAIYRLEQALFCFDDACIYTIHSFCYRILQDHPIEASILLQSQSIEPNLPLNLAETIVKDFYHSQMHRFFSKQQIKILLKKHQGNPNHLAIALAKKISQNYELDGKLDDKKCYEKVIENTKELQLSFSKSKANLLKLLQSLCSHFQGLKNKKGEFKPCIQEALNAFCHYLSKDTIQKEDVDLILEPVPFLLKQLDEKKIKKKSQASSLEKQLFSFLKGPFLTALTPLADPLHIFTKMAQECKKMLQIYFSQEEIMTPDDILDKTRQKLEDPYLRKKIRQRYLAFIVDEFQDTDPIQWDIFCRLFIPQHLEAKNALSKNDSATVSFPIYLVGDPKQSIYAFRNADIYTYLDAVKALGENNKYCLMTNYRSSPDLIRGLNFLFSTSTCPKLFELPKTSGYLNYQDVLSGPGEENFDFLDNKGAIHFLIADEPDSQRGSIPSKAVEENLLFPFIVNEIQKLTQNTPLSLCDIALLVKDRYQSARLQTFLKKHSISFTTKKSLFLTKSPIYYTLKELLFAFIYPEDLNAIKQVLSGEFFNWELSVFSQLSKKKKNAILDYFLEINKKIESKGFKSIVQDFLEEVLPFAERSVLETLLHHPNGLELFEDFSQLIQILIEEEYSNNSCPKQLLFFLETLKDLEELDEEKIKKCQNSSHEGVHIITLHASKGLEFPVVFPIALANQSPRQELVISVYKNGKNHQKICQEEDSNFKQYILELEAEKMRQLYVACTRAKYRLYVPLIFCEKKKKVFPGTPSAMEIFLAKLLDHNDQKPLSKKIEEVKKEGFLSFIEKHGTSFPFTYTLLQEPLSISNNLFQPQTVNLAPPNKISVKQKIVPIESFSSLKKQTDHHLDSFFQDKSTDPNIHNLESGKQTGIFLHKILQHFPFWKKKTQKEIGLFIEPYLKNTRFLPYLPCLKELFYHCQNLTLEDGKCRFSLHEIPKESCFREMEFIHKSSLNKGTGFLTGSIDLFFTFKNKYYLLDWKSNRLGSTIYDYSPENIQKNMHENDYLLQAKIYVDAMKRYLSLFEEKSFKEYFGGFFYVYLRGLCPQNPHLGVLHLDHSFF